MRPRQQAHHNPYSTLNDIVNEQSEEYDADADNLTLFTADGHNTAPKVAHVLGNLVRFPGGENPTGDGDGELSAKKSMLALLKKAVRCCSLVLSFTFSYSLSSMCVCVCV